MYGTEHTGIGRYLMGLLDNLQKIDKENSYVVLLREKYYKTLRLKKNWQKVLADYGHYGFSEQTKLLHKLNKTEFDLAHFPHFNIPLLLKKPFVVTVHDLIMHKRLGKNSTTRKRHMHFLKRVSYKFVFRKAIKSSKEIIVPSKHTKDQLIKKLNADPGKISVIHEGVDDRLKSAVKNKNMLKEKYANLPKDDYIIYVGNVLPHKNIQRLIEAVNYIEQPRLKLLIVTSNNIFKTRLQSFVKKIKANQKIVFLSNLKDSELSFLYNNSLAFVYPSLEEGFGLPGLEAIQNETLTLVSDIPVFKEVYGKHVEYFNPLDFSSIQKSIEETLSMDKSRRKAKIEEQKKLLRKYSLEKQARQTLKVYESSISI